MSLDAAIDSINEQFGKGSILTLGDPSALVPVEAIPTGCAALDEILGVGGLPRGRIVEVFGPESSGKTTLVLSTLASAQVLGLKVAFIDAEHALDPVYAKALGCDVDSFLLSQPDYGEQALEIADRLVRSGEVGVVAIDSVAALTPKAELDGEMGQGFVGLQARMMGQAMRKLAANCSKTRTLLLLTNQIREKVGVLYGSPETQPGGRALKFYASVRIDVRRKTTNSDAGVAVSNTVKFKTVKNKVAPPYREAFADIVFGHGFDKAGPLLDEFIANGKVRKSGAWYYFTHGEEEKKLNGRDAAKQFLVDRGARMIPFEWVDEDGDYGRLQDVVGRSDLLMIDVEGDDECGPSGWSVYVDRETASDLVRHLTLFLAL